MNEQSKKTKPRTQASKPTGLCIFQGGDLILLTLDAVEIAGYMGETIDSGSDVQVHLATEVSEGWSDLKLWSLIRSTLTRIMNQNASPPKNQ